MYYKPFHDLRISALGLGALRFPSVPGCPDQIDREKARAVIEEAFAAGINFFDTAYTYQNGDSERVLGEVLHSRPRDSYYLSTKFYEKAGPDIRTCFEEQLRRCQTGYFDFYLLHSLDENFIDAYMDPQKDYLGYLLKQKEAGRIRYLGFSTHATPDVLERFLNWYDGFDMAIMQLNYLDWTLLDASRQYELLTEHHIPVWVMEPLKGGRLAALNEAAASILIGAAPDRSLASWGFRFLMGLPNVQVVLSGMSTPEQVRDNAQTFSAPDPLSETEQGILSQAAASFLKDMGVPCSGCRYCCKACPANLDIPLLIQGYNERQISGETWKLASLARTKGAGQCLACGTCLEYCPQKINIPDIMQKICRG